MIKLTKANGIDIVPDVLQKNNTEDIVSPPADTSADAADTTTDTQEHVKSSKKLKADIIAEKIDEYLKTHYMRRDVVRKYTSELIDIVGFSFNPMEYCYNICKKNAPIYEDGYGKRIYLFESTGTSYNILGSNYKYNGKCKKHYNAGCPENYFNSIGEWNNGVFHKDIIEVRFSTIDE